MTESRIQSSDGAATSLAALIAASRERLKADLSADAARFGGLADSGARLLVSAVPLENTTSLTVSLLGCREAPGICTDAQLPDTQMCIHQMGEDAHGE
jgi:hypothetical protein